VKRKEIRSWTKWQRPVMKGYRMTCCDCGLTHEMEFVAFVVMTKPDKNGYYRALTLPPAHFGVAFRVRRARGNKKST
jgi:hypothetical protein